jgi:hypothetical protein
VPDLKYGGGVVAWLAFKEGRITMPELITGLS